MFTIIFLNFIKGRILFDLDIDSLNYFEETLLAANLGHNGLVIGAANVNIRKLMTTLLHPK